MAKAIVTGGATRVGKYISLALAKEGFDIILIFNNSIDSAKAVSKEIQAMDRNCHMYKCDLSKKESLDSVFAEISQKHDDITLLVNNASIFERHSFLATTEQIYDEHFNTNLKAPFFLSQNFVYYVNKHQYIKDACIVNIVDEKIAGIHTEHFAYHLTKKALADLTKMLAKDLAPKIRVNSISLGKVLPSKGTYDNIDLNKYPRLREIADVIIGFASSDSMTGKNISIETDPQLT